MELKKGYTTGSCAAIAVRASIRMIFDQKPCKYEQIITPNGVPVKARILCQSFDEKSADCAVKKYSGDDPDVTNGILVFANVVLTGGSDVTVDGGVGVGRVTKKGLQQNIGDAAINPVPMQMIKNAAADIFDEYAYHGGASITIYIPDGEEIAKKTFNPRLGIVGGISILGTTGIVEPMSEQAIIDTIKAELSVKRSDSDIVMIAPGNYGVDFLRENYGIDIDRAVKCSNYIGEALDFAVQLKFSCILIVGHIGKLCKLSGGIMNTHSKNADSRMELLAANAAMVCDDISVIRRIMDCVTTDDAVDVLKKAGICGSVMERMVERAMFYTDKRVQGKMQSELLMFSNIHGELGASKNAVKLIKKIRENM